MFKVQCLKFSLLGRRLGFFLLLPCLVSAQQTDWEKYDLKGKVKKVTAHTRKVFGGCEQAKKMMPSICISEFDSNGKLLKNTWKQADSDLIRQVQHFSYQDGKTILKVDFYYEGKKTNEDTFFYTSEEEIWYLKSTATLLFFDFYKNAILTENEGAVLEYDSQQNWISKHYPEPSHCQSIVHREIEYY